MRYKLSESLALKGSYSRMVQYMHRVSSSAIAFPTDIWYPVTKSVSPQLSDQLSLSLQKKLSERNVFMSVEGYYKEMKNLVGYREGTNLFLNTGHGTLGWTLAAGSGKALADIMSGREPEVDFKFTR